ncbi:MAG TPA: ATP-binding protein [Armatimonadota bacterium]|jgi:hypothetical protein
MDWLFPKGIENISFEELKRKLLDVPESLYVEYKGPETAAKKDDLGKAIAALANTHGGWLFVGIEADPDNENKPKPEGFTGVARALSLADRFHDIARGQLDPGPHVEVVSIAVGPEEQSNRIVAVHVEESDDPPLIKRLDGRVYVRAGAASSPLKEEFLRDRAELEALYEKARRNQSLVEERLSSHGKGGWLIDKLRERRDSSPLLPDGNQRAVAGDDWFVAVVYPYSASFRLPEATEVRDDNTGQVGPKLRSLHKVEGPFGEVRFADQHTPVYLGDNFPKGLLVNVYGHVAVGRLLEHNPQYFVRRDTPEVLAASQQAYDDEQYFGRAGLLIRLRFEGREVRIERVTTAPLLGSLDIDGIIAEIDRGLGGKDQGPRQPRG